MFIMSDRYNIIRNRINIYRGRWCYRKCMHKSRCTPAKMRKNLERISFTQYMIIFLTDRARRIAERDSISPFLHKLEVGGVGSHYFPAYQEIQWEVIHYANFMVENLPGDSNLKIPHPHRCRAFPFPATTTVAAGGVRGTSIESDL